MTAQKIILLFSGGLDSRVTLKLLKDQGYDITAAFFKLPFASFSSGSEEFLKNKNVPLEIFDCTKGYLFQDYLNILKHPEYGRGVGYNPCTDCKIFMLKHTSNFAVEHGFDALATGEVPGQRPMSQTKGKLEIIRENTKLPIMRPLEKEGIQGRTRKAQMQLASHYNIDYPSPGGGCLLCEKALKNRLKTLIEKNIVSEKTVSLVSVGKHFYFEEMEAWLIAGRYESENKVIEQYQDVIRSGKGKPAVYYESSKNKKESKVLALKMQQAFQDKNRETIDYFTQWKL